MTEIVFHSTAAEIRHIVENAERWLKRSEIYAKLTRRCSLDVFGVILAQMLNEKKLRKRRAPKKLCTDYERTIYGPGPVPVPNAEYRADRRPRVKGFMAEKREREARARARRKLL